MSDTDTPQDQPAPEREGEKPDTPDKDWQAEADKWKALARKHETQAKTNADAAKRLAELEDADKSETERAKEAQAAAERRAAEAESKAIRMEVALDKAPEGMALAQIRKLSRRLTGATREELETDADELFADFTPDTGPDEQPRSRPKERLRPGAAPTADPGEEPEPGLERLSRAYADSSTTK